MNSQYLRSFLLLCVVCAAVLPAIAQWPVARKTASTAPNAKADPREVFVKQWVDDYNKHGTPIITVAFVGLRPLSADLEDRLLRAFPKQKFSLADLKFHHHGWWDESYGLLQSRKSGRVILFGPPLNSLNGLGAFSSFLSAYSARDETDALFKASALVDFLAVVTDARVRETKRYPDGFSMLICLNTSSLTDLGATLYVPLSRKLIFGHPYFLPNSWERNKCPAF